MDPFVLLDDASSGTLRRLSGLACVDRVTLADIDPALKRGWAQGLHCFAWLPYEAGAGGEAALYWFAESTAPTHLPAALPGRIDGLTPDVTLVQQSRRISEIQAAIAAGRTYQVNYTFRLRGRLVGDPVGAYLALRERQPAAFGVLARLPAPAPAWLLSLSPELFIEVSDGVVTARPMKGTAPADTPSEALRSDAKNRAENLMIVDLLRNDISRVAVPGTVSVPRLFETERVGSLWQMTSTVQARLTPGTTTGELLRATFPCGSITGAPKLASMAIIEKVEASPRGTYTGSLGVLEPGGDLRLSVAIRTVEIEADGSATLGVGSGVVADSVASAEWDEALLKGRFVSPPSLKEAIAVVDGVAPLAALHQARLSRSAAILGLPCAPDLVARTVAATPPGRWRVGLELGPDGPTVARTPLGLPEEPAVALLEAAPWHPGPNATMKTSDRAHLDAACRRAATAGAFDSIGHDAAGRVLEGGRSNVFALIDGLWLTPPVTLGLLPGVQRQALLTDPSPLSTDRVLETSFTVDQLRRATRIVLTNAVAGLVPVTLKEETP